MMIKSGYAPQNESVNTYISSEDKISLAKLKTTIYDYPADTYLKYCTKGRINDISPYTYGLVKLNMDHWCPYSSIVGKNMDTTLTNDEVLKSIISKGAKNIAVKLPRI